MEQIEFDYTQPINDEWKKIMEKHLRTAKTFEIHCWNEETTWIEYALKYGTLKMTIGNTEKLSWDWYRLIL